MKKTRGRKSRDWIHLKELGPYCAEDDQPGRIGNTWLVLEELGLDNGATDWDCQVVAVVSWAGQWSHRLGLSGSRLLSFIIL
jgi:hypothetical protein